MHSTKIKALRQILREMKRVLVAYSGGADSAFLLKVAVDTLGKENVLAVTAKSPTYQASELKDAVKYARHIGAKHVVIKTNELEDSKFSSNPVNRCYYCKNELFSKLKKMAGRGDPAGRPYIVVDASNADDLKDYRPGSKAKARYGVRSPLQEAGFTKKDVRAFSRKIGLSTWDKPAMACLASRLPYGDNIDSNKLIKIEAAEAFLRRLGFRHVRVRCHGDVARIEVPAKDIKTLNKDEIRGKITVRLKALGFLYITLDLQGYRTGSLNEVLKS